MTLHIDKLRLRLPASHRLHANAIAHGIAEALARIQPARAVSLDSLSLDPIRIGPGTSIEQVTQAVVGQVTAVIGGAP